MAEGVKDADADGVVSGGTDVEPPDDPDAAPYGWTRDKNAAGGWRAKKRPGRGGNKRPPQDEPEQAPADDGRDPEPSWREPAAAKKEPYKASKSEQNEVAALLGLFYSVPADFLLTVDPYCFGALNANLESVVDATVPLICRSEKVVKYVTGASGLILWIRLLVSLKPVFVAAWQHHVIHSVHLEQDDDGMPVALHSDFSAYSAA